MFFSLYSAGTSICDLFFADWEIAILYREWWSQKSLYDILLKILLVIHIDNHNFYQYRRLPPHSTCKKTILAICNLYVACVSLRMGSVPTSSCILILCRYPLYVHIFLMCLFSQFLTKSPSLTWEQEKWEDVHYQEKLSVPINDSIQLWWRSNLTGVSLPSGLSPMPNNRESMQKRRFRCTKSTVKSHSPPQVKPLR